MVWRTGIDARCTYVNASWLAFTGRSFEQEVAEGWGAGVHPDDVMARDKVHRESFELRRPFAVEYRMRRADGTYRSLDERAVPYTDADGAFAGFIGSCIDVDERRAHDHASADFFARSLDNLCVAGFDGYFKRVNASWTTTLGWTEEELMSKPSAELVHPEDLEATLAGRRRLTTGEALGPLVNRYRCKDGGYRWFEWRSVGHGERGLVYAAARDITEQRLAEQRLVEANARQEVLQRKLVVSDRMASVGTLAAGVAHEINNPLAVITANVSMVIEELDRFAEESSSARFAESREMAIDARLNAARIQKIVLDLETFARSEAGPAVREVGPILQLAVNLASHELRRRARVVTEYGPVPAVFADEARLAQVFLNLLVNAAQSLPEGQVEANEIRVVTSTDASDRAVIEIGDSGPGIPAALLERIFEPFFTPHPVGRPGLGLSICHNLVTAMGGEITVVSVQGRGTTFRVTLPAAPPAIVAGPEGPACAPTAGRARGTILVVDDERAVGVALKRVLRDHEVTVVTLATDALALLTAGRRFDVILSDIAMPAMSGMAFYDELARRFPEVAERVIFVSGGSFTLETRAFFDRVSNTRIGKPFDPRTVREAVERLIT